MNTRRTRIVLADDHPITRHGIRMMLESIEGIDVVGEASNGSQALTECRDRHPDIVVLDVSMPGIDGVETTRRLKRTQPEISVIALTMHEEEAVVLDAMRAGVSAYVSKSSGIEEIRAAFDAIASGGVYVAPLIAGRVLREISAIPPGEIGAHHEVLTEREREVLTLLGRGSSAHQIAGKLGISERTVNTHVGNLYRRLAVNNRVDAVREAMRIGLVEAPRRISLDG